MRNLLIGLLPSLLLALAGSGIVLGDDRRPFSQTPSDIPPESTATHSLDRQRGSDTATAVSDPGAQVRQQWVSAIGNDRIATLRQLLARYEPRQLLTLTASNGKNALMVASKKGDLALVKSLIDAGADIDERTQTNGTAFMFAVLGNRRQVAEWLLDRGADIQVIGSNGWTALTLAAAKGYTDLVQWLIDNGAQTQIRDVYRFTPFMRAVENGQDSVARLLAKLPDTDVNAQDEYDNTALHHAVSGNDMAMVRLLLQHGADPQLTNRNGATPIMLAEGKPAMRRLFP
ncbi:ankyrin repeat domain-containing protein [Granulosicoccus sp. 3-233]|uniref:ankyrin repeat domain-containing protein n=1 Tax=Granulosicoccus sp. 3-233 TaxID=3417969 RepID=UPI003D3347E8